MPGPSKIEAYAIVSADGMLADANRRIPPALVVEADQKFFHGGLDQAAAVAHGRHSHEGGPRADARYRLILTSKVDAPAPARTRPKALLWNPKNASLADAWAMLGAPRGSLAVIGGPEVYQLFLDIGYDELCARPASVIEAVSRRCDEVYGIAPALLRHNLPEYFDATSPRAPESEEELELAYALTRSMNGDSA